VLTEVTDRRVAQMTHIVRPTALFVDKSSSMTQTIEVAKEIAALISAVCADFRVLAFDSVAFEVKAQSVERSTWKQAFKLVRANGSTSIGAPLAKLTRERRYVEQVVIIIDMDGNTHPYLAAAYVEYAQTIGTGPQLIIVGVGGNSLRFLNTLHNADVPLTVWEFGGDYFSLPNLLPLMALPSRAELVEQIMSVPLPVRS